MLRSEVENFAWKLKPRTKLWIKSRRKRDVPGKILPVDGLFHQRFFVF